MQKRQSICQAVHPFEKQGRPLVRRYSNELHWGAVVDEGLESMLSNEVGKHISRVLRCIRSPGTRDVLMAEALGFLHIFEEGLMVAQPSLLFSQLELSPDEYLFRPTRKMDSIP